MKWLWRLLALVIVLVVLAVGVLFLVPVDRIARLAADRFEQSTGRTLDLGQDIRPTIWPVLGITTDALSIGNADWAGQAPMIEAAGVSIGIDPGTIFGDIRVTSIEIADPVVRLSREGDGRANWDMGRADSDSRSGKSTRLPSFDVVTITNGTLIFQTDDGTPRRFDGLDVRAEFPDPQGAIGLSLTGTTGSADLAADVTVEEFASFLGGETVAIDAALNLGETRVDLSGVTALAPFQLAGDVTAEARNLADLIGALGGDEPDLARGLGRENFGFVSALALSGETLELSQIDARLDHNELSGRTSITFGGDRPVIDAELALGDFDLSSMETGGGAKSDADGRTTGWSKEEFDVSGLERLDGRIAVEASSFLLGSTRIDDLSTETKIENARAVTEIRRLRAYDGTASGSLVLNAREGFSTRLDVAGSAIAISRLLAELVGYDRIIAAGDLRLDVLGVGRTMDRLMNSLNGDGSFNIGAGELVGLDIVGMLRNLDPSYMGKGYTTIFDEITGTFRIVDGVVINDDLRLTAPLFRASGSGQIGIGGQTLDLRVTPELLGGQNAGIKVPLRVTGSWQDPKVRLDLEGALRSRVEEEARDRIQKELGGAAGDGLEETLKKGLGGLLGR